MCSSPDDAVAGLQECDLPGARFPYIWLDAICIKSSGEGRAKSTATTARSHSQSKETSASPSRPPVISPPTRKERTSLFGRDLVPIIIVSIHKAESCRN